MLGQNTYQPTKSLSARPLARTDKAKYGDGDLVSVELFNDKVQLGKMTIPSALIGAAPSRTLKTGFAMSKANGLLGLGFLTDPRNAKRRDLVQLLYDMKLVKHASFAMIGPRDDRTARGSETRGED